jgi:ABC-type glycerol-3-phosphate transport system substrate-binding protein
MSERTSPAGWVTRRMACRLGGVALVVWAAACRSEERVRPTAQPVSLLLWEAHSPQMTTATEAQRERFHQKVPHIRVVQEKVDFGTDYEKLIAAVAGGSAPDIAPIWSGLLPQFAAQGAIVSLDQYGGRTVARELFPAVVEYVEWQGKLWGLPYSMSPRFYVYNKDHYAAAGIGKVPATWDELIEVARKLTDEKTGGFSVPTSGGGLVDHFSQMLWQSGGEFFDKDVTRATFHGPAGQAALQFLVDLVQKHRVLQPSGQPGGRTGFLQGTVASFIDGPWIFDERNRVAPHLQYDVAEPPIPRGGKKATFASTGAYAVFGQSKYPKEAAEFIKFVSSKEGQVVLIQHYKGNARGDIYDEPEVKALVREMPQITITRAVGPYARISPTLPEWGQMSREALQPNLGAAMAGKLGVKEALDEAARIVDTILAARKR